MNRNFKTTVVLINVLLALFLVIASYRDYMVEAGKARLLDTKFGLTSYVDSNMTQLVSRAFIVALLGCGIFLEIRKSKIAMLVNIGAPLCLLIPVLINSAASWHSHPREAEIGLVLVALPLLAVVLLYATLYRRDLRSRLNRKSPVP